MNPQQRYRYLIGFVLILLLFVSTELRAVEKLNIEFTDDPTFLPLDVSPLHKVTESRARMQIRTPTHVYHAKVGPNDSALLIRAHNADLRQDQPATFSLFNNTRATIIVDHPIRLTLRDVSLYDDTKTELRNIVASGYRSDSAFIVKREPFSEIDEFLFLTTGVDHTGNGIWNPGIVHLAIFDYDYDGKAELFLQINSARDLLPRELFCIELESLTIEWSLPVAPLIVPNYFHMCGDSTDPQIIFTSYNPQQNVTTGEFSDLYSYVTIVDKTGSIRYNKIIASIYGGTGVVAAAEADRFMVVHSLPFIDGEFVQPEENPVHTVSLIDIEGKIHASVLREEQINNMWSMDSDSGDYKLYVLSTTGILHIYDAELNLLARSEKTVLRSKIGSLKLQADKPEVWVMATKYGFALYDHAFKQLAFLEAVAPLISPLEYSLDSTLVSFIMSGSDNLSTMSIRKKSVTDYLKLAFWRYKSLLLLGVFALLISLFIANHLRRRSQRMLRRTEAQLHAFFEASPDLAFMLNTDGVFTEFVAGAEKDLLVPPSSFIHEKITEVLPPDVAEKIQVCLNQAVATQKMASCDYSLLIHDVEHHYEVRIVAMSHDKVLAVVRNQSERVRTEKLLADSESRLRVLFDGARDAILLSDGEVGTVVEMNQAAVKLFGRSREVIIGSSISSLCSVDNCNKQDQLLSRLRATGEPSMITCEVEKADGVRIPVEMSSEIVEVDSQKMVLSFVRDISQQVKSDQQRIQSEGLQKEQYKNFPVATYTWRLEKENFVLVDYNDVANALAQGQMERFLNIRATEMYHDRPEIVEDLHKCGRDGETLRRNIVYDYKSTGEQRHLLATYVKVAKDLVTVYTEDVTEQRIAELALKENEEKLRAQYKGIPVPTYTWQIQAEGFVLVDFNDAAVDITKGGIKDYLGIKLLKMYTPDADVARDVNLCHESQEMIHREMDYYFQSTGLNRLLTVRYVPVPPDLVMVHTEDITERKQAEQELQRSEERFRALAESSLQGIFLIQEGKVTYSNERFAEILGRTREYLLGMEAASFIDLAHPDDRELLLANYQKRLLRENEPGHYELRIDRPDGTERWIEISTDWIKFGDTEAIQGVAIDITDRRLAELKVHQTERDRYNQIREMAGGVSHEIYNALYPAMVALDKLTQRQNQSDDETAKRDLKLLRMTTTAVQRAIEMTEQVTQYSKLESSTEQEIVKLRPLITEIILSLSSRMEAMKVDCLLDVPETAEFECLRPHAFSMINNLVINALDSMEDHEKGALSIWIRTHDEILTIKVVDTGCGITTDALHRVFDPFYSTKPKTGTGLGLAVVRRIVSLYEGSISVDSQLDRGTTFNILLPMQLN